MKVAVRALIAASVFASFVGGALAADPEQTCQVGRAKAAGKYAKCIQGEVAKTYAGAHDPQKFVKCATKYSASYDKLRAKAQASPGSETCDAPRFVDNGDGTVTDNLTTLQWEQKTDDSTVHDKDNAYWWSNGGTAADGTAFATFLAALNGAGFAGQYDWRLPTEAELLSIMQSPCAPCIDAVFGPTVSGWHWSASSSSPDQTYAWYVDFTNGYTSNFSLKTFGYSVRAVRGG